MWAWLVDARECGMKLEQEQNQKVGEGLAENLEHRLEVSQEQNLKNINEKKSRKVPENLEGNGGADLPGVEHDELVAKEHVTGLAVLQGVGDWAVFDDFVLSGDAAEQAVAMQAAQEYVLYLQEKVQAKALNDKVNARALQRSKSVLERFSNRKNALKLSVADAYKAFRALLVVEEAGVTGVGAQVLGQERAMFAHTPSVRQLQREYECRWNAGLVSSLHEVGHMQLFASGVFDGDVAQVVLDRARGLDGSVGSSGMPRGSQEGDAIGQVVAVQLQEVVDALKGCGARLVGRIEDLLISHDMYRIRLTPWEQWHEFVLARVDRRRTFGNLGLREIDRKLIDLHSRLVAGEYVMIQPQSLAALPQWSGEEGEGISDIDMADTENGGLQQSAPLLRLYFEAGSDYEEYNREYGLGSLAQVLQNNLEWAAKTVGLMQMLGTEPQVILKQLLDECVLQNGEDKECGQGIDALHIAVRDMLGLIDGSAQLPQYAVSECSVDTTHVFDCGQRLGEAAKPLVNSVVVHAMQSQRAELIEMVASVQDAGGGWRDGENSSVQDDVFKPLVSSLFEHMALLEGVSQLGVNDLRELLDVMQQAIDAGQEMPESVQSLGMDFQPAGLDGNFLACVWHSVGQWVHKSEDSHAMLSNLDVFYEAMLSSIFKRFGVGFFAGGQMTQAVLDGLSLSASFYGAVWWQQALREACAKSWAHHLGRNASLSWAQLSSSLQNVLADYGIQAHQWEVLRNGVQIAPDGKAYLTPLGVALIDRSVYAKVIQEAEVTVDEDELHTDLSKSQIHAYLVDNWCEAIPEALTRLMADCMEQAIAQPELNRHSNGEVQDDGLNESQYVDENEGLDVDDVEVDWSKIEQDRSSLCEYAGMPEADILRHARELKAQPMALVQMVLGGDIFGCAEEDVLGLMSSGQAPLAQFATFLGLMTAMGYVRMCIKATLNGGSVPSAQAYSTWVNAMQEGGALAMYADYVFGLYVELDGSKPDAVPGLRGGEGAQGDV